MFNKIRNWFFHEDLKRQNLAAFIMLIGSVLGLLASFMLSIEALILAKNSHAVLSCDLSSVLSCSTVANHWSATILGFPNSFIGVMTLPVMVTIAGAKFPKWFMQAAQAGAVAGMVFAIWMFYMSYIEIGALCPWCLTLDVGMTLTIFGLTRYNILRKNISWRGAQKFVSDGYDALIAVSIIVLVVVAIIAKFGGQLF